LGRKGAKEANAAVAGILNWLWGGVAYFLLGQTTKGILFSILTLFLVILDIVTCGIGMVIHMVYNVVLIVDAILLAGRINRGEQISEWQFF